MHGCAGRTTTKYRNKKSKERNKKLPRYADFISVVDTNNVAYALAVKNIEFDEPQSYRDGIE